MFPTDGHSTAFDDGTGIGNYSMCEIPGECVSDAGYSSE